MSFTSTQTTYELSSERTHETIAWSHCGWGPGEGGGGRADKAPSPSRLRSDSKMIQDSSLSHFFGLSTVTTVTHLHVLREVHTGVSW